MMKKKKGYRNGGKIKGMMNGGRMKAKEIEDVLKPLSIILNFQRLDSKAQASADLPKYKFNAKMADVRFRTPEAKFVGS